METEILIVKSCQRVPTIFGLKIPMLWKICEVCPVSYLSRYTPHSLFLVISIYTYKISKELRPSNNSLLRKLILLFDKILKTDDNTLIVKY